MAVNRTALGMSTSVSGPVGHPAHLSRRAAAALIPRAPRPPGPSGGRSDSPPSCEFLSLQGFLSSQIRPECFRCKFLFRKRRKTFFFRKMENSCTLPALFLAVAEKKPGRAGQGGWVPKGGGPWGREGGWSRGSWAGLTRRPRSVNPSRKRRPVHRPQRVATALGSSHSRPSPTRVASGWRLRTLPKAAKLNAFGGHVHLSADTGGQWTSVSRLQIQTLEPGKGQDEILCI